MRKLIIVAGALTTVLGVAHFFFPVMNSWSRTLAPLHPEQAALIHALAYGAALLILGLGLISLANPTAMVGTTLGRMVCALAAATFGLRLVEEFVLFDAPLGQKVFFATLCGALTIVYLAPVVRPRRTPVAATGGAASVTA